MPLIHLLLSLISPLLCRIPHSSNHIHHPTSLILSPSSLDQITHPVISSSHHAPYPSSHIPDLSFLSPHHSFLLPHSSSHIIIHHPSLLYLSPFPSYHHHPFIRLSLQPFNPSTPSPLSTLHPNLQKQVLQDFDKIIQDLAKIYVFIFASFCEILNNFVQNLCFAKFLNCC